MPAIEVAALVLGAARPEERRQRPRLVDLFCTRFGVWMLSLVGIAVITAAIPPAHVSLVFFLWLNVGAALVLLWSLYVDYCFFRDALGRPRSAAVRGLFVHRLLSWTPIVLVISQPAILSTVVEVLGL